MKKKAPSDSDLSVTNAVAGRDDWLSTREASVKLSCSLSQVQKMVEGGILSAWKTSGTFVATESRIAMLPSEAPQN